MSSSVMLLLAGSRTQRNDKNLKLNLEAKHSDIDISADTRIIYGTIP